MPSTPEKIDQKENDLSTLIPVKVSPQVQLPPVGTDIGAIAIDDGITVNKKRKIQLVADTDTDQELSKVIPSKSRNNSVSKRIGSLSEISKPELSPPISNKSYKSIDLDASEITKPVPDTFSSPLKAVESKKSAKELRRLETSLTLEIRSKRKQLETIKKAQSILNNKKDEETQELVDKWRNIAQKASHYLLNSALDKINKTGGKVEFQRRERERLEQNLENSIDYSFQDKYYDITHSEEFENLKESEKERILEDLEIEQEKTLKEAKDYYFNGKNAKKDDEDDDNENTDEFTMKDLYKQLKLNYKLVFNDDK